MNFIVALACMLISMTKALLSSDYVVDLMTETTSRSFERDFHTGLYRCEPGYTGSDCNQRKCPYSMSFINSEKDVLFTPSATSYTTSTWPVNGKETSSGKQIQHVKETTFDNQHAYRECGGRGLCDRSTGECKCFPGFTGEGCRRTSCPNDCSGHGECRSDANSFYFFGQTPKKPFGTQIPESFKSAGAATWGINWSWLKFQQCHCDAGYEGDDCSLRRCPRGNDPETDCAADGGVDIQQLDCEFQGGAKQAFFQLRFVDQFGAEYDTRPIKIDPTGMTEHENANSVQQALESLPNFAIPAVEVDVNLGDKVKPVMHIYFSDGHNTGKQKLLEFFGAAACASGSQPLFRVANSGGDIQCTVSRVNIRTGAAQTPAASKTSRQRRLASSRAADIQMGWGFTLLLQEDGSLWVTGRNSDGELGLGSTTDVKVFTKAITSDVQAISAGDQHSMVLKDDGTVWATGWNHYGQLGDGTTANSKTFKKVINGDVTAIAGRSTSSMALKKDGSLWAAGRNQHGQFGDGTKTNSKIFKKVTSISDVTAIFVGLGHKPVSMALKKDGSLWATGYNGNGQFGDGTTTDSKTFKKVIDSGVQSVDLGNYHSLAVKQDGSLWVTGKNTVGQLGDGTKTDVKTWKKVISSDVVAAAAGTETCLVLKQDGTLLAAGGNTKGQFGDGTGKASLTFKTVATNVVVMDTREWQSMVLKKDGGVYGAGHGSFGRLGTGGTGDEASFKKVRTIALTALTTDLTPATTTAADPAGFSSEFVSADKNYKEAAVCSGRGICDQSTGLCNCFDGYFGLACDHANSYL